MSYVFIPTQKKVDIIEAYVCNPDLSFEAIGNQFGVSAKTVGSFISCYLSPPGERGILVRESKINDKNRINKAA